MLKNGEIAIYCEDVSRALEDMLAGRINGQVIIRLNDVRQIFEGVLSGAFTREEASNIAFRYMQLEDSQKLKYIPIEDEKAIWDAISYLMGIDLKDTPGTYLHDERDVKEFATAYLQK